jgi:hypothetical protein
MTVTLPPEQFHALARLALVVENLELRARLQITEAIAKRNAYYQTLAATYALPPAFSVLALHDETYQVDITPAPTDSGPP